MRRTETRNRAGGRLPLRALRPLLLLLLAMAPTALRAQDAFVASKTGSLGIRLDGGLSWSLGGGFANTNANALTAIQPQGTVGLFYNISPRFRAGLDYGYSRMVREQTDGTLTPLSGGGVEGEVYRDLKTNFHAAELTAEYNLLGGDRVSLYAGTGFGCQFAAANTYTIGVKNEVKNGGTGNSIQIKAHNEGSRYVAPYVPVTLSLEYAFLPQVAVSLGGGYRFVFAGKKELSPKGQAFATLGLRFNLK